MLLSGEQYCVALYIRRAKNINETLLHEIVCTPNLPRNHYCSGQNSSSDQYRIPLFREWKEARRLLSVLLLQELKGAYGTKYTGMFRNIVC